MAALLFLESVSPIVKGFVMKADAQTTSCTARRAPAPLRVVAFLAGCLLLALAILVMRSAPGWLGPALWYMLMFAFLIPPALWYYALTGRSGFGALRQLEADHKSHRVTFKSLVTAFAVVCLFIVYVIALCYLYFGMIGSP